MENAWNLCGICVEYVWHVLVDLSSFVDGCATAVECLGKVCGICAQKYIIIMLCIYIYIYVECVDYVWIVCEECME